MRSTTTALRRVARIVNGGTPTADETNWAGDVPWATPVDLARVDGGCLPKTDRTLTRVGLSTGSASVPPRSVILSTRAPIGYAALVLHETAFNQGCRGLVPRSDIEPRFLLYVLMAAKGHLQALGTGSTFQELSTDALAGIPVPVLPLERQRRIAAFLDDQVARLDLAVARIHQQSELSRAAERAWTDETLDRLGQANGWLPLKRWLTRIEQGWSPSVEQSSAEEGQPAVLKLGSVRQGRFRENENKALPAAVEPRHEFEVAAGDLLASRANTRALVGEAAVVPDTVRDKLYLPDLIYRLRLVHAEAEFVSLALRGGRARGFLGTVARGTSESMAKLRGDDFGDVMVPEVDRAVRLDISTQARRHMATTDAVVAVLSRRVALLQERKRALITAAVTGEFDVSTASGRGVA